MNDFLFYLYVVVGVIVSSIVWSLVYGDYRHNTLGKLIDLYEKWTYKRQERTKRKQMYKLLDEERKRHTDEINE